MTDAILLDTHTALWLTSGSLEPSAVENLADAALGGGILVSPITAWEVGQLCKKSSRSERLGLIDGPARWFATLTSLNGVRECKLDAQIAWSSTILPGEFHKDPADRMLVATARALGCPLMTRDEKILSYADQGYLRAIPC